MKARGLTTLTVVLLLVAGQAQAGRALQHSGQAIQHSANAVGLSMVGGTQLVSGVLAVPLKLTGELGGLSGNAGEALWEVANAPIGEPLPIAEDSITAGPPPAEALFDEEQRP